MLNSMSKFLILYQVAHKKLLVRKHCSGFSIFRVQKKQLTDIDVRKKNIGLQRCTEYSKGECKL